MEIAVVALMLLLGLGLLIGPRVARRRRAPSRAVVWNGATRSRRRAGTTSRFQPAAPVDDDAWDDDLEWVDAPAYAERAEESPAHGPAPVPAPAGRTWDGGDTGRRASQLAIPKPVAHPAPSAVPAPAASAPAGPLTLSPARSLDQVEPSPPAPARTLDAATATAAPPAPARSLDAAAAPGRTLAAASAAPLVVDARAARAAAPAAPARPADDIDPEWTSGIDVPPPRIARGAAAFGAAPSPTPAAGSTRRGILSRHPVLLVAAYATAGIALVVLGVSFVSSQSFRSTDVPAGDRVASVTPEPTVARTPAATPTARVTPAPTADPAKAAAVRAEKRARAAWLSERGSSRRAEGRSVDAARAKFRAAARDKKRRAAARAERSGSSGGSQATPPTPAAPAPVTPRPAPRPPQPLPCEFCIE